MVNFVQLLNAVIFIYTCWGFTPKTDLESLYNQVQNATFGPVGGGVTEYANLNPFLTAFQRSVFLSDGRGPSSFILSGNEQPPLNIGGNTLNITPK